MLLASKAKRCFDLNSPDYVKALRKYNISAECHIFPHGGYGLGLATGDNSTEKHVTAWKEMLIKWLEYIKF